MRSKELLKQVVQEPRLIARGQNSSVSQVPPHEVPKMIVEFIIVQGELRQAKPVLGLIKQEGMR